MSTSPINPRNYLNSPANLRLRRWRMLKDKLARHSVAVGGVGVILAIVLIFFYLLYVVLPLFEPASIEKQAEYPTASTQRTLYLAMEEQAEIGLQVTALGELVFFDTHSGAMLDSIAAPLPAGTSISAFSHGDPQQGRLLFGLSNGEVLALRHVYRVSYPNDVRKITPDVEYPLGESPLEIDSRGFALTQVAFQDGEDEATLVSQSADGRVLVSHFSKQTSLLGDEVEIELNQVELATPDTHILKLLLDKEQRNLYIILEEGSVIHYDIADIEDIHLIQRLRLVDPNKRITSVRFLTGDISLLVGDNTGRIVQWFSARDDRGNQVLTPIREFTTQQGSISDIAPEYGRKGFLAVDRQGVTGIYHTTAEQTVLSRQLADVGLRHVAISPRANAMLVEDESGRLQFWQIHNEHPEVSWSALWEKVWYESYQEPVYSWQSSSASNDFEPKLSLTPLLFGTIKAAFYAMLLAVPLAILGAIYTAYFMSPSLRKIVKPSIETMEALPTVILGFLAGLWLAPFMESNLPGIFSLMIITPVGILVFAFVWHHAPPAIRHSVPEGWDAALLVPVVIILAWISLSLSTPLEDALFNGDVRAWMNDEFGIGFDQRNALVVGLAMGFAVIPTIFSITEDAIFSVPKHLTYGSLALGATPWQTLTRVVILTASPGIFSAVMIGLGRAVGETMIVLMATGNTPVMDLSIFQGMRTLSANIAVEMPESEVDSTHYRVLFLAALVLFIFTFFFNTVAEIIRQRLRLKYSSL